MPKALVRQLGTTLVHKGMLMQRLGVIIVAALVWGNSAYAAVSTNWLVTGGDLQVRISILMEHFAHKHPELNVKIREKYANYHLNEAHARLILQELTLLDIVVEQNQPDPAEKLQTATCKRAFCAKEDSQENDNGEETQGHQPSEEASRYRPGYAEVTCKKPAC